MAPDKSLNTLQSPGWFQLLSREGPPGKQNHLEAGRGSPGSALANGELPPSPGVRPGPSRTPGLSQSGSEAQPSLRPNIQSGPRAERLKGEAPGRARVHQLRRGG